MRTYANVSPMFWVRGTGKRLRGHPEAQVVALYLMTCPAANIVGIFPLALPTLCHETGLTTEGARKGLAKLSEEHFAFWDEAEELVWIPAFALYQVGERISLGKNGKPDNRAAAIRRALAPYKGHLYHELFLERYAGPYHLGDLVEAEVAKGLASPHVHVPDPATATDPESDPDAGARAQGQPSEPPRAEPPRPTSRAEALEVPVCERSKLVKANPYDATWLEPERWPEVVVVAKALAEAAKHAPYRLGSYPSDSGLVALVELFAAGYEPEELVRVARSLPASDWWRKAGASQRGLKSLTPEVVRRELDAAAAQPKLVDITTDRIVDKAFKQAARMVKP